MEVLCHYNWRGNVRELENVIKRLVILSEDDLIRVEDIPDNILVPDSPILRSQTDQDVTLPDVERNHIISVLQKKNGDKKEAAKILGISLKTLYNKLKLYDLET